MVKIHIHACIKLKPCTILVCVCAHMCKWLCACIPLCAALFSFERCNRSSPSQCASNYSLIWKEDKMVLQTLNLTGTHSVLQKIQRDVCVCVCTHMCVCVCICMCVCMHACTCVCVHAHLCAHVCVFVCACMCVCICVCICMYACTCMYMCACTRVCVCVCIFRVVTRHMHMFIYMSKTK